MDPYFCWTTFPPFNFVVSYVMIAGSLGESVNESTTARVTLLLSVPVLHKVYNRDAVWG